ncbi:MAG: glycosyltransferase [Candidatus Heimdallarchaeaceae archaeon]
MTFLIKTFFREEKLIRLIDSIKKYFTNFKIVIADDSLLTETKMAVYNQLTKEGHKILLLPFDSGLSKGRNELIKNSEGAFVMCDDDFVFTEDNGVEKAIKRLNNSIITGNVGASGNHYSLKKLGRVIYKEATTNKGFHKIDMGLNFFVSDNHDMRWDERIKINHEHLDFFLTNRLEVYHSPDLKVEHDTTASGDEYGKFRNRNDDYFFDKWNIDEIKEGNIIIRRNK